MTITVFPLSTKRCKTLSNNLISSKCKPVVGSSKTYKVLTLLTFDSSVANFILWASPPESVVACDQDVYIPSQHHIMF